MLADELDFEENTVSLALGALEQLNMIVTNNGFFSIAGWEEYQNIEGMDKIREQNRLRQAKFKQKQKLLEGNVTDNVTVTQGNATDIEEDKDLDKEKDVLENTSQKRKRFVPPTLEDVQAYCDERQNGVDAERFIDYYTANGWLVGKNKMKDWKAAVRTWERNETGVKKVTEKKPQNGYDDFMSQLAAMRE
jgi:hypothetical protein